MKYFLLFFLAIMLNACESAQKFKRPESSQQNCGVCTVEDTNNPILDD